MKRKRRNLVYALVVQWALLVIFNATAFAADAGLKAAGCKTEYFLLKDIVAAYHKNNASKIQLGSTGNKKAVNLLLEDKIEFTFTCKPIDKLRKGLGLDEAAVASWKSIPIAKDPIVVVANRKSGIQGITSEQLTRIFQGQVDNWRELEGNDLPVETAYMSPRLESGVVLLFKEFTVGVNGQLDPDAMIANGPSMLGNFTAVTPGSVVFMGFNSYKEKYGDILQIDGVSPTRENILNGTYSLAATYYLTLDDSDDATVSRFVDYVLSDEGSKVIDTNFISLTR